MHPMPFSAFVLRLALGAHMIDYWRVNMSCTIFYKGTLKEDNSTGEVLNVISKHLQSMNAKLVQNNDAIVIHFLRRQSEPLVFDFIKNKVDGFCKWNGDDQAEFYGIFDMFIELKPLFKSLKVDDDEGLWNEYVIQWQPCKIKLRPLSASETKFLDRVKVNEINPPGEIEKYIMSQSGLNPISLDSTQESIMVREQMEANGVTSLAEWAQFMQSYNSKTKSERPFYHALLRIIAQDFVKIMQIDSIDDFKPQEIVDLTNELKFWGEVGYKEDIKWFDFHFCRMMLVLWISYTFEYKKMSRVKDLSGDVRGLQASKIAASGGIESIFLNRHSGGASNSKEAEMRKLAKKYYKTGNLGKVMVIDEPERTLEFFFSMMEYLGFNYVGME